MVAVNVLSPAGIRTAVMECGGNPVVWTVTVVPGTGKGLVGKRLAVNTLVVLLYMNVASIGLHDGGDGGIAGTGHPGIALSKITLANIVPIITDATIIIELDDMIGSGVGDVVFSAGTTNDRSVPLIVSVVSVMLALVTVAAGGQTTMTVLQAVHCGLTTLTVNGGTAFIGTISCN